MKNSILMAILWLTTMSMFATTLIQEPEVDNSAIGIFNFFLPAIISSALVLLTDASKWWSTGLWDWGVFWNTKIKPFLISVVVAIGIYIAIVFVPLLKPLFEGMAQYNLTEVTAFTMIGLATALIDNLMKKEPTPEEQRVFANKHNIIDEEER